MESLTLWLEPQPAADALPSALPSPFGLATPHPLVRAAALGLQAQLRQGVIAPGFGTGLLDARREGGKMFGVLLVRAPDARVGFLKAFSGQLAAQWEVPGWVPPVFDAQARLDVEPASDVLVKSLTARMEALASSEALRNARSAVSDFDADCERARAELKVQHSDRKRLRQSLRAALTQEDVAGRKRLDDESRQDDVERRSFERRSRDERRLVAAPLRRLERRLGAMERLRRRISQEAMRRIQDTYLLTNARGSSTSLRALFAPG
ncbi:MAG: RluA family pseudouridine synthase, partial [Myxococcaceae bacterium]|nr:RluA family pseudouridine synthase [Myxococcaceae bacterium]